jgi:hypothetical protein
VYINLIGNCQTREETLDLEALDLPAHDLHDLGDIFTEEEVWNAIKDMPSDRAPRPDGFL